MKIEPTQRGLVNLVQELLDDARVDFDEDGLTVESEVHGVKIYPFLNDDDFDIEKMFLNFACDMESGIIEYVIRRLSPAQKRHLEKSAERPLGGYQVQEGHWKPLEKLEKWGLVRETHFNGYWLTKFGIKVRQEILAVKRRKEEK